MEDSVRGPSRPARLLSSESIVRLVFFPPSRKVHSDCGTVGPRVCLWLEDCVDGWNFLAVDVARVVRPSLTGLLPEVDTGERI